MGFFNVFKRKTNNKAVFLGLDNSGKSTIISFLQEGKFIAHAPTMGKQKAEIDIGGTRVSLFDMGGQSAFRQMWTGEIKNSKVVVFVIDKAAPERFEEAKIELDKLLPVIKNNGIHLILMANKHDLPGAVSIGRLINEFNLCEIDNFEILEISAKTGYGMADAFANFFSNLTGEKINRGKMASAISVFTSGGVPIISQVDTTENIEVKAIEGGFLVAITQFSNMKMKGANDLNFISFESDSNGTFLVAKTTNYIGSCLWTKDLGIKIEQSKSALNDLLEHLEYNCNHKDEENVAFYVEQYITNLI
ncbi:MAG: ADP-ribosylation factor-like protein [Promethearchaeota archaeon]